MMHHEDDDRMFLLLVELEVIWVSGVQAAKVLCDMAFLDALRHCPCLLFGILDGRPLFIERQPQSSSQVFAVLAIHSPHHSFDLCSQSNCHGLRGSPQLAHGCQALTMVLEFFDHMCEVDECFLCVQRL